MDIDGRREDWLQRVRALREAGAIDDADEHALIRQYDERAQRLREELAKLDAASERPKVYPYWHQAQFSERNPFPV